MKLPGNALWLGRWFVFRCLILDLYPSEWQREWHWPVHLLKMYCQWRSGLYNPSLRHASIFTEKMWHIFSILKLFLSKITNPKDLIQEYVLVWCLKGLYLLDKWPAACHSAEMNGTIKSSKMLMIEDNASSSLRLAICTKRNSKQSV